MYAFNTWGPSGYHVLNFITTDLQLYICVQDIQDYASVIFLAHIVHYLTNITSYIYILYMYLYLMVFSQHRPCRASSWSAMM